MVKNVWFGTREYMQWVPAPAIDVQAGKVGHEGSANFLNGGAWVRRSKAAAKTYSMSWNLKKRDEIQPILDYADGMYGNGLIYYSDPFAMDKNVLPSYWAAPYINAYDGPLVVGNTRPTITTGAVENGYPYESANYTLTTTSVSPKIFIPIPPGYRAYVGAHGQSVSGTTTVRVTPYVGTTAQTAVNLTLLSKAANPTNWISTATHTGIELSLVATANGVLRLHGIVVQVLPAGSTSPVGGFISGQGTSGLSFVSQPAVSQYNAALDRIGVSADLIETGAWQ